MNERLSAECSAVFDLVGVFQIDDSKGIGTSWVDSRDVGQVCHPKYRLRGFGVASDKNESIPLRFRAPPLILGGDIEVLGRRLAGPRKKSGCI